MMDNVWENVNISDYDLLVMSLNVILDNGNQTNALVIHHKFCEFHDAFRILLLGKTMKREDIRTLMNDIGNISSINLTKIKQYIRDIYGIPDVHDAGQLWTMCYYRAIFELKYADGYRFKNIDVDVGSSSWECFINEIINNRPQRIDS